MFYFAKIIANAIEFASMILVSLSLFRIYFRYSLHKVALIAFIMALISVYFRDVINEPGLAAIPVIASGIVLITIFFGLPLIFSILIFIIGSLATTLFEGIVVSIGTYLNLFSPEKFQTSLSQFILCELIVSALLLLLVYPLQKYKLGFHTTINDAQKGYNFLLSAVLVIAVVIIQIQTVTFKESKLHIIVPIFIGIIFLAGIYLSYKHNQKLWKNRRERLSRK
ncbi:hypothetical protein [Paenibacillus sp. UNC451MF]|uniref:hypothetical protein n=1 Tax=Paenibacillus sp. UNC451MF TaxID=1449063 RepID=UPI00048C314C|nr:hypothetical protein [Paenibacillus sp. UNC451MF]